MLVDILATQRSLFSCWRSQKKSEWSFLSRVSVWMHIHVTDIKAADRRKKQMVNGGVDEEDDGGTNDDNDDLVLKPFQYYLYTYILLHWNFIPHKLCCFLFLLLLLLHRHHVGFIRKSGKYLC